MSREGSQELLSRREGLSEGRAPSFSALNTQTQASGRVPRWQAVSDWHTGAPRRDGQSPAALILSRETKVGPSALRDACRGQSTVSIRSHQTALTSTFIMVSSHSGRVSPGTEGRGNPCSSHLASSGCLRSSPWLRSHWCPGKLPTDTHSTQDIAKPPCPLPHQGTTIMLMQKCRRLSGLHTFPKMSKTSAY